ncbi:MAG: FtsW/RodA/SpoVE family cell cycle protein [Clostridiales bacterium]|nr:FtsW/RodA/SpoVE family cell cycle protein [Clostridiales bacterium]
MKNNEKRSLRRDPGRLLSSTVMLFFFSAFLLLFLKDYAWQAAALAVAVPAMIWLGVNLLPRLFPADKLLLSLTNFLCALGVLVLYATNPDYAYQQATYYGVGLVAMVVCIYLVRIIKHWKLPVLLLMPVSLALLALPLLIGRETNGAKNWFYVGSLSVQPSEIVKLSLLLIISYFMSRRRLLPWLIFAVGCLGLLMLQKDLGTALMYYGVTLMLFYASSNNLLLTGVGLAGGAGAAVLGYKMFAHVKKRVAIWQNPWSDYDNAGYQIVQSLMAIASGGIFGMGLGLGYPQTIPVYHTDFIFSVICEQFGVIFGLCVLLMYVAIIWRGATTAMAARTSFHGLLAMGATLMIGLQTFVIIGGVIKLIPLTGVTMPFVSYGGTSLVSSMCLVGLLQGVASLNEDDLNEDTRLAMLGSQEGMQ